MTFLTFQEQDDDGGGGGNDNDNDNNAFHLQAPVKTVMNIVKQYMAEKPFYMCHCYLQVYEVTYEYL